MEGLLFLIGVPIVILFIAYAYFGWGGVIVAALLCVVAVALIASNSNNAEEEQVLRSRQPSKESFFITKIKDAQRIFSDSYHIITTTTNIETFCSRYELLLEKEAELRSGITIIGSFDLAASINKEIKAVRDSLPEAKNHAILESYKKIIADADLLKTSSGKRNKLQKYYDILISNVKILGDSKAYQTVLDSIQEKIDNLSNTDFHESSPLQNKGIPIDYYENDSLTVDEEFERIRPELDQAAMQRSADFAARHEKQVGTINIPALEMVLPLEPQPLKPYETIFLNYMDGYRDGNSIAGYWTHDYHIDYQSVLEKFFSYRYMCFDDIRTQLSKYKISDFKEFLSSGGLKVTGKKEELISRIMENFDAKTIDEAFPRRILKLTDAGKSAIEAEDYILYFDKNTYAFSISIALAEKAHIANPDLDKFSLALKMLTERAEENLQNKDYGLYRNDLLGQSSVYHDAGNYTAELELLCQVCFLDYYGYGNNGTQSMADSFFAPAVLYRVKYSQVYQALGEGAEEFYFQSVRKLPPNFSQKSRPHFSYVKMAAAVEEYTDKYNH